MSDEPGGARRNAHDDLPATHGRVPAPQLALAALVLAGSFLAWLAHDAPLAPAVARGWLHADALSALALIALGAGGLVDLTANGERGWRLALGCALLALAALAGHLGLAGGLLLIGGAALTPDRRRWQPLVAAALAAGGLWLIGWAAGEWRHGAPAAGGGLSSLSFAMLLVAALLAADLPGVIRGRTPRIVPPVAVACLYALLRLFSLGPWNLGWLFAALVAGGASALGAAWLAAAAPRADIGPWLGPYYLGLAIVGAGLGSGAGVTMAGYALLVWPLARLALGGTGGPRRSLWLLTGAVPLTAPFMLAWMAVAAAVAGGLTILAAALWLAALLAGLAVARLAAQVTVETGRPGDRETRRPGDRETRRPGDRETRRTLRGCLRHSGDPETGRPGDATIAVAAALSLALGLGAPLVIAGLLGPLVAQLQGGLTPFGEIVLWPWAGLIALDATRQPVATMPSVALAALMLILAALCWVALRLAGLRRGSP